MTTFKNNSDVNFKFSLSYNDKTKYFILDSFCQFDSYNLFKNKHKARLLKDYLNNNNFQNYLKDNLPTFILKVKFFNYKNFYLFLKKFD